ncbi:MAG: GDSL-type esterase/lipase family protein [Bacteroidaceae bacterium]|nr:GDSL-type esterase/lipase family protein [Bacteroidaceae bacterium]
MKKTFPMLLFAAVLILSACKSEPIRVACLGDSITYGHGIMDREHDAYPGVLASMLGEKYDVRNFGVCGVTAMSGTDMPYVNEQLYRDALEFNPQIVTIKLGTNDSKPRNWVSHENFKTDVKAMIAEVRSLPSKPQIWLCLPVPAMGNAWTINDSIIYNGVIPYLKEIAAEENLPLIDLNTPFQGQKQYFPDTIHPNEEGERMIAGIIFDRVFKKNR